MIKIKNILFILALFFLVTNQSIAIDSLSVLRETFLPDLTTKDSLNSIKKLERDINRVLSNKYLRSAKIGIAVYSLNQDKFLYQKNIDETFTPASTTKLVTTFTALQTIGYDSYITTEVYSNSNEIKDGVLCGDLFIIGFGDAFLEETDLEELAEDIKSLGITKIDGNIYADGSFFDEDNDRFSYSKDRDEVMALPPITALSINRNHATVLIQSGSRAGKYVNVQIIPNSESFSKYITAKVKSYSRGDVFPKTEKIIEEAYGDELIVMNDNRRSISISSSISDKTGKQLFTIRGYMYPNRTLSYKYHIESPESAVAGSFKNRLQNIGIEVTGDIDTVSNSLQRYNESMHFLAENARPLGEIVKETNKESDNYLAENIFKMIGAFDGFEFDCATQSRFVTERLMSDLEINYENCTLNDGSGLSRRNLLKPITLIELLKTANELELSNVFESSLAIAGKDGTLEKRMRKSPAENNLRGKTGTLRNVSALSGYVNTLDGEKLAFAFMFNGGNVSSYKRVENELGELLARFFYFKTN